MAENLRALVVDDEESYRRFVKRSLERRDFHVRVASSPDEADKVLEQEIFDVIVLDILMPGETGVSLLKRIKRKDPFAEIILISGHATVESAIEALRGGATDYIEKPFTDSEQVLATIERAAQRRRARTGPWDILLISTDAAGVSTIVNTLNPHSVLVVENGEEAMAFLTARVFHLVLLDLDRTDVSAPDTLTEVVERFSATPVIALTAAGDDEMAARAIEMGAQNFVRKDAVKTELAQCVVEVLDPNRALLPQVRAEEVEALMGPSGALRFVSGSENFYRLLINSMAEACFVVDSAGTITFANESLEKLTGLDKDKILGWKGHELFSEDSQKRIRKIFDSLVHERTSRTFGAEVELKAGRGDKLPVLLRGTTLHTKESGFEASFILMTDIREQKERERKLRELVAMQNDFISMTSHELNTPLAVIAGSLSLLNERVFGEVSEQQSKHLTIIERNVGRLQRLVKDLLDISRIDSGRLSLQPTLTDMRSPVMSACQALYGIAQERGIKLIFPGTDTPVFKAVVDGDRIEQVVLNLVNNALRYAASRVEVKLDEVETENGAEVRVAVEDDGPGIAEEDLSHLFTKFYRGLKSSQAGKGTGLGLTIVKGLVEAHGGKVTAGNRAEGGSRFTVLIPKTPVPDVSKARKPPAAEPVPTQT